jgi:hypothetical protein
MSSLLDEIRERLALMFTNLERGEDVAPAARLRTEGLMEAAVLMAIASEQDIDRILDDCYRTVFGGTIEDDFGEDWRDFYPFPQIPAVGRRAPVYPSTKE